MSDVSVGSHSDRRGVLMPPAAVMHRRRPSVALTSMERSFTRINLFIHLSLLPILRLGRGAEYCDQFVSLSVSLLPTLDSSSTRSFKNIKNNNGPMTLP